MENKYHDQARTHIEGGAIRPCIPAEWKATRDAIRRAHRTEGQSSHPHTTEGTASTMTPKNWKHPSEYLYLVAVLEWDKIKYYKSGSGIDIEWTGNAEDAFMHRNIQGARNTFHYVNGKMELPLGHTLVCGTMEDIRTIRDRRTPDVR